VAEVDAMPRDTAEKAAIKAAVKARKLTRREAAEAKRRERIAARIVKLETKKAKPKM